MERDIRRSERFVWSPPGFYRVIAGGSLTEGISMNIKDQTIAHIGLGRMGAGIAKNIQAADCRFIVYNRSTEKMQPFVAKGAKAARTPREAASVADIVVTSLMDDK